MVLEVEPGPHTPLEADVARHPARRHQGASAADQLGREAFAEAGGVDDHLRFVHGLKDGHAWSQNARREIEQTLARIDQRRRDSNLYLGVVGEFSSGKSTFLNAVMRDDLLRTDVLQATTAAATWMRYGEEIDVEVDFGDGEAKTFRADGQTLWRRFRDFFKKPTYQTEKERLRAFVHTTTAEEEVAAQLKRVTVYHSAEAFQRGLVIIDTPGANAQNERHVRVAAETLLEHCDGAIVVIPADIPASQSMLDFVREHLSDAMHRCIFLVTKLDLIRRARERERLLPNIERRLARELGLETVQLLAAAPRVVVDEVVGEESNLETAERKRLIEEFETVEDRIWQTLESQRDLMQLERLSVLMSRLFSWLPDELQKHEETYRQQHDALVQNQIPDLGEFVRCQSEFHNTAFRGRTQPIKFDAVALLDTRAESARQSLRTRVFDGVQNAEELKLFLEAELPQSFQSLQHSLEQELGPLLGRVSHEAQAQLTQFEHEFKEIYQSLATLGGRIGGHGARRTTSFAGVFQRDVGQESKNIAGLVQAEQENATGRAAFGVGAGLALGTFIAPGIGTLIGGAVGWLASKFFGPSLDELKQSCWPDVEQALASAFREARSAVESTVEESVDGAADQLHSIVERYFEQYDALVKQMIARDKQEAARIVAMREQVQRDQNELRLRREQIEHWRAKLRSIPSSTGGSP